MPRTFTKRSNYFGPFIRRRREELSLTQREIAEAMDVSAPEFVGMIEAGRRKPNFERLPALAKKLKLPPLEVIQMAFVDVYPSLIDYFSPEKGSSTSVEMIKMNEISRKLLALSPKHRQPIIKMINTFYEKRKPTRIRRVA